MNCLKYEGKYPVRGNTAKIASLFPDTSCRTCSVDCLRCTLSFLKPMRRSAQNSMPFMPSYCSYHTVHFMPSVLSMPFTPPMPAMPHKCNEVNHPPEISPGATAEIVTETITEVHHTIAT